MLRAAGYPECTLARKEAVVRTFVRWAQEDGIDLRTVERQHFDAFLGPPQGKRRSCLKAGQSVLLLLMAYLRHGSEKPELNVIRDLFGHYVGHLQKDRGLAENSVLVYSQFVRDFLVYQTAVDGRAIERSLTAATIQDFLLAHIQDRSDEYGPLLATSRRSFFRFLYLRGLVAQDFSGAVPTTCKCRQAAVPTFLSPEETDRVLAATDRFTVTGRRDYAVLLLLARLGLRAGEIVRLELDDLRWRSGEVIVHGKGRMVEPLPLLAEVGDALVQYLAGRGQQESRRVFLRVYPPCEGLAGPATVGHIVRAALRRAGVRRSGRGAAHLFRHGLATQMIRSGATLTEISEVLRHRSLLTTAMYTHVSFEALRAVAGHWPLVGGLR
jgi:site-specific recombinase XerD